MKTLKEILKSLFGLKRTKFKHLDRDEPTFKEVQNFVGGSIEMLTLPNGSQMLFNEDGRALNLTYNEQASKLACQRIVGNVMVLSNDATWC